MGNMTNLYAQVGKRIERLREEKGLTQTDLAKKAHLSQGAISKIECGNRSRLALEQVERIATALGVGMGDIYTGFHESKVRGRAALASLGLAPEAQDAIIELSLRPDIEQRELGRILKHILNVSKPT